LDALVASKLPVPNLTDAAVPHKTAAIDDATADARQSSAAPHTKPAIAGADTPKGAAPQTKPAIAGADTPKGKGLSALTAKIIAARGDMKAERAQALRAYMLLLMSNIFLSGYHAVTTAWS
jgi:hypothetical protein